jgi:hypothetical protein
MTVKNWIVNKKKKKKRKKRKKKKKKRNQRMMNSMNLENIILFLVMLDYKKDKNSIPKDIILWNIITKIKYQSPINLNNNGSIKFKITKEKLIMQK